MPGKTSPAMAAADLLKWPDLEKGDMIQFNVPEKPGKMIHHWAVYVGNGQIIHFTPVGHKHSFWEIGAHKLFGNASVDILKSVLVDFAKDEKVRVNNWADGGYYIRKSLWQQPTKVDLEPYPPEEIVRRANEVFERKNYKQYNLLENNCEIFATTCRYGRGISGQSIAFGRSLGGWF